MSNKNYIGKQITIPVGAKVRRAGETTTRKSESTVTVRKQEAARNNRTRVYWKSNGVLASFLLPA